MKKGSEGVTVLTGLLIILVLVITIGGSFLLLRKRQNEKQNNDQKTQESLVSSEEAKVDTQEIIEVFVSENDPILSSERQQTSRLVTHSKKYEFPISIDDYAYGYNFSYQRENIGSGDVELANNDFYNSELVQNIRVAFIKLMSNRGFEVEEEVQSYDFGRAIFTDKLNNVCHFVVDFTMSYRSLDTVNDKPYSDISVSCADAEIIDYNQQLLRPLYDSGAVPKERALSRTKFYSEGVVSFNIGTPYAHSGASGWAYKDGSIWKKIHIGQQAPSCKDLEEIPEKFWTTCFDDSWNEVMKVDILSGKTPEAIQK